MMFLEVDKHEVDPYYDHKDIAKMSFVLGAALKKILGVCRRKDLEFLRQLCVFGILAGDTVFDVCVAYPDFAEARVSEFANDQPFPPYSIIYRYSKDIWRFNLYGDEDEHKEDIRSRNHSDFHEFFFEPDCTDPSHPDNQFKIIPPNRHRRQIRRTNDHVNNKIIIIIASHKI